MSTPVDDAESDATVNADGAVGSDADAPAPRDPTAIPPDAEPPLRVEVHPDCEAIVDFDPALTFECVDECTWCCHHGVLLYEPDLLELAEYADLSSALAAFRGEDFVKKEPKGRRDRVGEDGEACFFLRDDGLCALQAEHGWKPTRCSIFPLSVEVREGDIHVAVRESAREHCEGLGVSERRVIAHLEAFLPAVLWSLDDPATRREL